ncbi:MAG TPA: alpha/beta hydrolase family protein, partial [Candidatus Hydrogenedens sp.]|nr:alpha/beta hydrolase family protein [Candidatus Hydrogenedens sp.]
STGQFAVRVLLQRFANEDGYAPEFGIGIEGNGNLSKTIEGNNTQVENTWAHELNTGREISFLADNRKICFPDAAAWRKGIITGEKTDTAWKIVYLRSRDIDKVPHQPMAWRMANVYVGSSELPAWNELLEPPVKANFSVSLCSAVYDFDECPEPENEILREVVRWHRNAMATVRLYGDDFGNVSTMPQNAVFGMNRLNHNTEIFYEYLRTCSEHIRKTFMLWCQNYAQLSVWWGDLNKSTFGGTRYNNITANNPKLHADDKNFMWRSNDSVTFCTKGIENFLLAYEETGDPFYSCTLNAQVAYAKEHVHANTGECRNIGAVKDFMLLYKALGKVEYAEKALRLFQELREKLSEDNLFSQGGEPIQKELPFIDDDRTGYNNPFPKPYILGYALQGLPDLYMEYPSEPRLYETIEAVAKYMAETVDPAGGWRYPHPRSTWIIISQGIEHAHQIANACKVLKGKSPYLELCLDAIETVLQARIAGLTLNQCVLSSLGAWEYATGKVEAGKNLGEIYKKFDERDYTRDYTEGQVTCGDYVPPEGVVYFSSVLDYYLQNRNASNVLSPKKAELRTLLQRLQQHPEQPPKSQDRDCSIEKGLPKFTSQFLSNYVPALRYDPGKFPDFGAWKREGQKKVFETLGYPPPFTFFNPEWICEEDRGSYTAKKLKINISEWERIPAYLLIPKGTPPFPAVICLHDHGAHFSIGKEKVVRPIAESEEVMKDALDWVGQCYEGRFVGDELATRGYVVLVIDALFWGARQECEGSKYENQQQLGSNIFHLGTSWLGIITWDDIRSAEFLASLLEVDSDHIGAVGLSMGAHRTWMLSALSDNVKVGCAICWLATTPTLIVPDNNQTRGQSAYSMLAPNLYQYLDIPDVAGLACPKPMLFFNGKKDSLFPIEGVEEAHKIMHKIWDTQNKSANLYTKIWDEPHVFNKTMQEEAFAWLDKHLKTK